MSGCCTASLNKNLGSVGSGFGDVFGTCFCFDFCLGPRFVKTGKRILSPSSFFQIGCQAKPYCTRDGRAFERVVLEILCFFAFLPLADSSSRQEGAFPLMRFNLKSALSEI